MRKTQTLAAGIAGALAVISILWVAAVTIVAAAVVERMKQ